MSNNYDPVEILQNLIRFNTTNPPGNEAECINYTKKLLHDAGLKGTILAKDKNRPNLIARLKGRGDAPPLMLYGHVDVVPVEGQEWTHPPFEGKIVDGYIWGRGALDMKGGIAMFLAALLRSKAEGLKPAGDIIFAALSDEEGGKNQYGAKFLVKKHKEYFKDVRYAIGEMGGFPMYVGDKKFYLIQVAEKQKCSMEITIRGPGGHGSMPLRGNDIAAYKMKDILTKIQKKRLPLHVTTVTRNTIEGMTSHLPLPKNIILNQLLNPRLSQYALKALGNYAPAFESMLHNTVNPTVFRGGKTVNVIPSEIVIKLDGRLLPGYTKEDMEKELKELIDDDAEIKVLKYEPYPPEQDMGLFDTLKDIITEADLDGIPIPMLLPGITDGRFFAQLGIQTYGFTPMNLPKDYNFRAAIHAADERIPVESVEFGANAIYELIKKYK